MFHATRKKKTKKNKVNFTNSVVIRSPMEITSKTDHRIKSVNLNFFITW